MNSYAEKTQTGDSHAIANSFSSRENGNEKHSSQFYAPGVIQRYTILQPDRIKAQQGTTIETKDIERTRYGSTYTQKSNQVTQTGINPPTSETTTESVSGQQQPPQVSSLPSFKVSANGFMAVPVEGQSKNFFGNEDKIQEANNIFIANGSEVRLKAQGAGITVPKNPAHPKSGQKRNLKKIHAASKVTNHQNVEIGTQVRDTFPYVQCNAFIGLITGAAYNASRVAVIANQQEQIEIGAEEGEEPINEISTFLSEESRSPSELDNELKTRNLDQDEKNTGKREYENLKDKKRSRRAKRLGINEFASPGIGEGFVIRSQETNAKLDFDEQGQTLTAPAIPNVKPTHSKKKRSKMRKGFLESLQELDRAKGILNKSKLGVDYNVQTMMRSWGEHYAGVVGKDGQDVVTLENYNRTTEISWEHERIFQNLFRDFEQFRTLVSANVDSLKANPLSTTITALVALAKQGQNLEQTYSAALDEATLSFTTGLQRTNDTYDGNFYFDMYGPGTQSFHEAFKGLSTNAMTLHIKETLGPVRQGALDNIQDLQATITRWCLPVLAHPMTGPAQNGLVAIVQQAQAAHQKALIDFAAAQTRGEFGEVRAAAEQARNNLVPQLRPLLLGAYQVITGNAPQPAINTFPDIVARCNAFRQTYYWFNRADAAYNNATSLIAMTQALIANHAI